MGNRSVKNCLNKNVQFIKATLILLAYLSVVGSRGLRGLFLPQIVGCPALYFFYVRIPSSPEDRLFLQFLTTKHLSDFIST